MLTEFEAHIADEIEEEVKTLMKMAKRVEEKVEEKVSAQPAQKVGYYRLMGGGLEAAVEAARGGRVTLVSLEGLGDGVLKEMVNELKREVEATGGKIYFVRSPALLILPKNVELGD